jgi:hypothetical protein
MASINSQPLTPEAWRRHLSASNIYGGAGSWVHPYLPDCPLYQLT